MTHAHIQQTSSKYIKALLSKAAGGHVRICVFDPVGDHAVWTGSLPVGSKVYSNVLDAYKALFDIESAIWLVRLEGQNPETIRLSDMLTVMGCRQFILHGPADSAPLQDKFVERHVADHDHVYGERV